MKHARNMIDSKRGERREVKGKRETRRRRNSEREIAQNYIGC